MITALHEAHKANLIEKLQFIVMQFSKFPAWFLDIPCADVFLDKFSDSSVDREEMSLVTPESDQDREIIRALSTGMQFAKALHTWRENCKEKADYR